jgi:hypothetical protein
VRVIFRIDHVAEMSVEKACQRCAVIHGSFVTAHQPVVGRRVIGGAIIGDDPVEQLIRRRR